MFAYVVGFGGGKERGISMLEAATKDVGAHVDARTALLIIFSREGRHLDALRVVQELKAEFPRNRVFTLEEGATNIRAGRAADADAVLTQGLTALERDNRPKFLGERAMWLYKRGLARVNLNRPADARADLEAALQNEPAEWVKGRIHLELGKVADLTGRRDAALGEYRQAKAIADAASDPPTSNEAARLQKRPFSFTK
jgi:tetratricopeptide (TPR) repeat protein